MAREKVGVTLNLEVWAYTRVQNGREERFGFVMTPEVADPGGIPYGTFEEGLAVVERLLREAHEAAAERRRELASSGRR